MTTEKISVNAAGPTVFSELQGILTLKEEQRMTLKDFLGGKDVFTFTPNQVWPEISGASWKDMEL